MAAPSAAPSRTTRARLHSAATRALFPRAAPLLRAGFDLAAEHHSPRPHWYLAFVGIDPSQQGRGLGRALLAPVHEQADRDGVACYLETPFPATHAFYRGLGYELVEELRSFAGGPPVWTMLREPR